MEDVWVWDKNRPSRIIPRAEVYTSGDVTVEELRGEGEEPRLTAEALAERIGQPLSSDDDARSRRKTGIRSREFRSLVDAGEPPGSPDRPRVRSADEALPAFPKGVRFRGRGRGLQRTRSALRLSPIALRQPLGETSLWGIEVTAEPVFEAGDLVAKLEQPVLEPALGIAGVVVSLVRSERGAALGARHVVGMGEGAGHARSRGKPYFALSARVPARLHEKGRLEAALPLRPVDESLRSGGLGDRPELNEHAQRVPGRPLLDDLAAFEPGQRDA